MKHLSRLLQNRWIRLIAGLVTVLIAIVIIYLSLTVIDGVPAPKVSDKVKHFVAYFALAAPMLVATGRRYFWATIFGCVLLGILLEFAQYFGNNGREGSALDALANTGGAAMGAALVMLILRRPTDLR